MNFSTPALLSIIVMLESAITSMHHQHQKAAQTDVQMHSLSETGSIMMSTDSKKLSATETVQVSLRKFFFFFTSFYRLLSGLITQILNSPRVTRYTIHSTERKKRDIWKEDDSTSFFLHHTAFVPFSGETQRKRKYRKIHLSTKEDGDVEIRGESRHK